MPLRGSVQVGGFKHAFVTLIGAALVGRAKVTLTNCPDIAESRVLARLLNQAGARVWVSGDTYSLDLSDLSSPMLDRELCGAIHGSVYLLPGLLTRFGRAVLTLPGGCRIGAGATGARPVGQYIEVLRRFGAEARLAAETIEATAAGLRGCVVDLRDFTADRVRRTGPLYSGATKTAILCAVAAHGVSRILHPYPKPDVTELVAVLRAMGAEAEYRSPDELVVVGRGPQALHHPVTHQLPSDLIELVTWVCLSALHDGGIRIRGGGFDRALIGLRPEMRVWDRMGVRVDRRGDALEVSAPAPLTPTDITAASHNVYSDSQPFLALLATAATGRSEIRETVWTRRFGYADGLARLGARVAVAGSRLVVDGPCRPWRPGQRVTAADLRAAAVLMLAALSVPGRTTVAGASHLRRGYADLPGALRELGADVAAPAEVPATRSAMDI